MPISKILLEKIFIRAILVALIFLWPVIIPQSSAAATKQPVPEESPTESLPYAEIGQDISLIDSLIIDNPNNGMSATRRIAASIRKKLTKKTYRADEPIAVTFNNPGSDQLSVQIINSHDQEIKTPIEQTTENGITEISVVPTNEIKPGKYKLIVSGMNGKMLEQDFTWGVLAINTNKSYYHPQEKAHLEFAVLSDLGNMVCDAKLTLYITNEQLGVNDMLTTEDGDIKVNPTCYSHDFTLVPDYESEYVVREEGIYTMTLTAETSRGKYTIVDSFIVTNDVPFDVERITATRIFPANHYPVIFRITAKEDFEGVIKEAVPGSFSSSSFSVREGEFTRETYVQEITPNEPVQETAKPDASGSANLKTDHASASAEPQLASESAVILPEDKPIFNSLRTLENKIQPMQITLQMPFEGTHPITQKFGEQETDPLLLTEYLKYGVVGHDGMDFGMPKGTPILASDNGTVIFADYGDYGKTVVIQHAWGRTYYGHLDSISVTIGDLVIKGNRLGLSGNTGLSTGPHLHFGVKPDKYNDHNGYFGKVDPLLYLNTTVTTTNVAGTAIKADIVENLTKVTSIEYPVKLKKGETLQIEYKYLAPQKSPEAYLLGPLQFIDKNNDVVFEESRQWQIASDAVWVTGPWSYRKAITILASQVSDADTANLSNFPVLINLSSDTELAANALDNGFDIMFTSNDTSTKIPAEIQSFNGTTGALVAWVNVPTLDYNDDTVIYMYYGNPSSCNQELSSCSDYDSTKNMNTTWTNANYVGVWHMEETPSTAQTDSTGNSHNATYSGSATATSTTGFIGNGLNMVTNGTLTVTDANDLDPGTSMTVTAWLKPSSFPNSNNYWFKHVDTWNGVTDYSYRLYYEGSTTTGRISWNWYNGTTDYFGNGGTAASERLSTSTFKLLGLRKLGNSGRVWMNGTDVTSTTINGSGTLLNGDLRLCMGGDCTSTGASSYAPGVYDEVRLASDGKTNGWMATEYTNQNNPSGFYTLGAQECRVPPDTSLQMRHGKYFDACGRGAFSW